MGRERSNPQVYRTFKKLGIYAEKKTDLFNAIKAQRQVNGLPDNSIGVEAGGHPDYMFLAPPFGGFVEVKDGEDNFNFAQISIKQRDWLQSWKACSWLWLFMGTGRNGSDERAAYLVYWPHWLTLERYVRLNGLEGLSWRQPQQLVHRELGLSITRQCSHLQLDWIGDNCWDIPAKHPFWTLPLASVPFFAHPNVNKQPQKELYVPGL